MIKLWFLVMFNYTISQTMKGIYTSRYTSHCFFPCSKTCRLMTVKYILFWRKISSAQCMWTSHVIHIWIWQHEIIVWNVLYSSEWSFESGSVLSVFCFMCKCTWELRFPPNGFLDWLYRYLLSLSLWCTFQTANIDDEAKKENNWVLSREGMSFFLSFECVV